MVRVKSKLRWIFLVLWLICVALFVVGQLLAPPEYHLLPNSHWGKLFGVTFISGIIFFCLSILFFVKYNIQHSKNKDLKVKKTKYNLSFSRLVSRIMLTGAIGIVFGIAMFPFMRTADGLLFEQKATIGGENMLRMVLLWGLFTLMVSPYTFWKKKYRMVSVLLFLCWLVSIAFYLIIGMYGANNYRCKRSTPYPLPNEFNRSLDLIAQRMGIDKTATGTIWQSVYNFRNCLNIQYSDANKEYAEAYFEYPHEKSIKNLQNLKIVVNPSYKNFDDLTLASLLAHEIVHVGQYINEVSIKTKLNCYEKEANAYTAQYVFLLSLNEEERRSIYARLKDNIDINPTFKIVLLLDKRANEVSQTCTELQTKNNLTKQQVDKCFWEGLERKLLMDVQNNPYYQKQCSI